MEKDDIIKDIRERLDVLENTVLKREEQMKQAYENFEERLKAINIVQKIRSLLQSTIESSIEGILVVAINGQISLYNKKFLELWRIPQNIIDTHDDKILLDFVENQLENPEQFMEKVKEIYATHEDYYDMIKFKDGRVFRRCSKPQLIDDEIVGRVWSFIDVTVDKI